MCILIPGLRPYGSVPKVNGLSSYPTQNEPKVKLQMDA